MLKRIFAALLTVSAPLALANPTTPPPPVISPPLNPGQCVLACTSTGGGGGLSGGGRGITIGLGGGGFTQECRLHCVPEEKGGGKD